MFRMGVALLTGMAAMTVRPLARVAEDGPAPLPDGKGARDWDRRGRYSLAQGDRYGAPHLHIRERARHRFPPGEARRAFIAAQMGRGAR